MISSLSVPPATDRRDAKCKRIPAAATFALTTLTKLSADRPPTRLPLRLTQSIDDLIRREHHPSKPHLTQVCRLYPPPVRLLATGRWQKGTPVTRSNRAASESIRQNHPYRILPPSNQHRNRHTINHKCTASPVLDHRTVRLNQKPRNPKAVLVREFLTDPRPEVACKCECPFKAGRSFVQPVSSLRLASLFRRQAERRGPRRVMA